MADTTLLSARYEAAPESPLIYLSTQFIQAKEYLEAIVASTSDAIVTTDLSGRIIYFSPGAERLIGRPAAGRPVSELYAGGREEAGRVMQALLAESGVSDYQTELVRADGSRVPVSMSASLLRDQRGKVIGTLGISKDISRHVELERRLRELTITDNLTGLNNRRCFEERLAGEVRRARRQRQPLAMLLIDLDRFKEANDLWGHLEGDRVLRETASILRQSIRRDVDTAYRLGGDEFVVLLPGLDRPHALKVARRICATSAAKDYGSLVTLSAGLAALRPSDRPRDLVRRADAHMYRVKKLKKRPAHRRA